MPYPYGSLRAAIGARNPQEGAQALRDIPQSRYQWTKDALSQPFANLGDVYNQPLPENAPSLRDMMTGLTDRAVDTIVPVAMTRGFKGKMPWQTTLKEYNAPVKKKPMEAIYIKVGDKKIEVVQNPTGADLRSMSKEARKEYPNKVDPALRHTEDAEGNSYYWKSHEAIHPYIEPQLSRQVGAELNQNAANRPSHRSVIRKALYEGEDVPKNVLDEYPGIVDEVRGIEGNKVLSNDAPVADFGKFKKKKAKVKEKTIEEIRKRVVDDLTPLDIRNQYSTSGIKPAHEIGDRFITENGVRLEIMELYYPEANSASYMVKQIFQDGHEGKVRLSDLNFGNTRKLGIR